MLRWVLLALFFGICASAREQKTKQTKPTNQTKQTKLPSLARGWGESIAWEKTYQDALLKMTKSGKPLMVIHHRLDCPHSKELKKAFVARKSIMKLAREDFIMLNLVEETVDKNMAPDGYYVPRILFVDPSKAVRTDITGKYSKNLFAYNHDDLETLEENMKQAKVLLKPQHKEL